MITVSRLLKSWATPPASRPDRLHLLGLAQLLLQLVALRSARLRSVMSVRAPTMATVLPSRTTGAS